MTEFELVSRCWRCKHWGGNLALRMGECRRDDAPRAHQMVGANYTCEKFELLDRRRNADRAELEARAA